jgi:hypothetical protein
MAHGEISHTPKRYLPRGLFYVYVAVFRQKHSSGVAADAFISVALIAALLPPALGPFPKRTRIESTLPFKGAMLGPAQPGPTPIRIYGTTPLIVWIAQRKEE